MSARDPSENVDASASNVGVIRRLNAAFNTGDWPTFESLLAPNAQFIDHLPLPDIAQEAHGSSGMTGRG